MTKSLTPMIKTIDLLTDDIRYHNNAVYIIDALERGIITRDEAIREIAKTIEQVITERNAE